MSQASVNQPLESYESKWNKFRQSPVAFTLIIVNVLVFAIFYIGARTSYDAVIVPIGNAMAMHPQDLDNGHAWALLTSMFMHGSIVHIACNMLSLYYMRFIEELFGSVRFTIIYFASGIIAGIVASLVYLNTNPNAAMVGASGAIFGLLGVLGYLVIKEKKTPFLFDGNTKETGLLRNFVILILVNVGISLMPNVSGAAHLGGFVTGYLLGIWAYASFKRECLNRQEEHFRPMLDEAGEYDIVDISEYEGLADDGIAVFFRDRNTGEVFKAVPDENTLGAWNASSIGYPKKAGEMGEMPQSPSGSSE